MPFCRCSHHAGTLAVEAIAASGAAASSAAVNGVGNGLDVAWIVDCCASQHQETAALHEWAALRALSLTLEASLLTGRTVGTTPVARAASHELDWTMAKRPMSDAEMDAIAEDYRRWAARTPISIQVALRRKLTLERCRKSRNWLKMGHETYAPEAIRQFLRTQQQALVDLRRYRETGVFSPPRISISECYEPALGRRSPYLGRKDPTAASAHQARN
jgi:hypothetical protein